MRRILPLTIGAGLAVSMSAIALSVAPASGSASDDLARRAAQLSAAPGSAPIMSDNVTAVANVPGQLGISGCFMHTAPLFVTSGLNNVRVFDVSKKSQPEEVGRLEQAVFENEAMTCGERKSKEGTQRFVLIGVDLFNAPPTEPEHTDVGGNELLIVDVTDPTKPTIRSQTPSETSTHTVACVEPVNCKTAYSAGGRSGFSIFDLRDLDAPVEVDADRAVEGTQPFSSPTGGHKWNFDAAGVGSHTGYEGTSMWSTDSPRRPQLLATTGAAGRGEDPDAEGYNDFIHHNSFRPQAKKFRPKRSPALRNGNISLITEEDYENPDCATAGSFQTWWVKKLKNGKPSIKPLDKVELADLGNFPSPVAAFCSAHWFDYGHSGLVAAGFYGGGTQFIDVTNPRKIRPYGHAVWGVSEVWDTLWAPKYSKAGVQKSQKTRYAYSLDLVRGLDVYRVDLPGDKGERPSPSDAQGAATALDTWPGDRLMPAGLVLAALGLSMGAGLVRRRARS